MVARHDFGRAGLRARQSRAETMIGMGTSMIAQPREMSTYVLRRRAKRSGLRGKMPFVLIGASV